MISQPLSPTARSEPRILQPCKEYRAGEIVDVRYLGRGAFGDVKLINIDGRGMAAKILNPAGAHEHEIVKGMLVKEVRAMAELQHENIVRLFGVCLDPGKMCILMEYMHQGSLRQVLDNNPNLLPIPQVFSILREIAGAMSFVHAHTPHPILHRDLKTQNILIDRNGRSAIADFGLAAGAGSLSKTLTTGGTLAYDAPEVLDEDDWGTAGDVYSFAVLAWETVTGKPPWSGVSIKQLIKAVLVKEQRPHGKHWDEPMEEGEQRDPLFWKVIKGGWAQKVGDRPSFADLFASFRAASEQPQFCSTATPGVNTLLPSARAKTGLTTMKKQLANVLQGQEVVVEKLDENKRKLEENQKLLREQGDLVRSMASGFANLEAEMKVCRSYHRMQLQVRFVDLSVDRKAHARCALTFVQLLEALVRDEISCPRLIWITPKPKVQTICST
jgi:serine/threonine protein kinase